MVTNVGYQYAHRDGLVIDRPEGKDYFVFVLFKSPVKLVVNGMMQYPELNSCILFSKNTAHYYESLTTPYVNDWIHFGGNEIEGLLERCQIPMNTLLHPSDPMRISRYVLEIQNEMHTGGSCRDELQTHLLSCILLKLAESGLQTADERQTLVKGHGVMLDIRNDLYSMPWRRPTVSDLAKRAVLSKSHFQHLYQEVFGVSVMTDMIAGRMAHACYLLENSTVCVSEIAESCGYANDVHFMRQFKKKMGLTPRSYRSKPKAETETKMKKLVLKKKHTPEEEPALDPRLLQMTIRIYGAGYPEKNLYYEGNLRTFVVERIPSESLVALLPKLLEEPSFTYCMNTETITVERVDG